MKCKFCNEEIDSLNFSKVRNIYGSVGLDSDGEMEFNEEYDIDEEQKEYTYKCPECNRTLFEDYDEAKEFLKGGKK